MARFCMFGGHDGQLHPTDSVHVTLFGGAEWRRSPAATQVVQRRRGGAETEYLFITVCGASEVKWPTLAEEYLALLDAVRSGAVSLGDWDAHFGHAGGNVSSRMHAFTLFGGFDGDALPNEDKELDNLSVQQHLGYIPEPAMRALVPAIGQRGVSRLAAVRQAVALALAGST